MNCVMEHLKWTWGGGAWIKAMKCNCAESESAAMALYSWGKSKDSQLLDWESLFWR